MVANGWLEWTHVRLTICCPPIIDRLFLPLIPSGTAASLSLSRDRARALRADRRPGRTALRYARATALRSMLWPPVIDGGSPCRKSGLPDALRESQRLPGTGKRATGGSHQLAVGHLKVT